MKKSYPGFETGVGLLLICVFATLIFLTLTSGAAVYRDVDAVMEEHYTSRTAISYLAMKARQGDTDGFVSTGSFGDSEALIIREAGYGQDYITYIYCWNGFLTELYCAADEELQPSDGMPLISAESLDFELNDGLLRMECVTDGGTYIRYVSLSSCIGGAE